MNSIALEKTSSTFDLDVEQANQILEKLSPQDRVVWSLENLPSQHILSSSFGIQSAVMLHMVSSIKKDIPVVLTDTGYLFKETYQFIDKLVDKLDLNLIIYRSDMSPGWQEARHGYLWEKGLPGIELYNKLNKVEPMNKALDELDVGTWFTGLRRSQSSSRKNAPFVQQLKNRYKVFPILEWSNRDVHQYLTKHDLPYHPLWEQGYVSVGDWHTSRPLEPGMSEEETRFFGLKRECGLHEFGDGI